jgi:hypothetical protein
LGDGNPKNTHTQKKKKGKKKKEKERCEKTLGTQHKYNKTPKTSYNGGGGR